MQSIDSLQRIEELNGTMRQSTPVIFNSSGNTFPSPVRPVQQVNGSPISMLGGISSPIRNQTTGTTTHHASDLNVNPLTYRSNNMMGSIWQNGRDSLSLLTDLSINRPREILPVNNAELFRRVQLQSEGILTTPSMYGKN